MSPFYGRVCSIKTCNKENSFQGCHQGQDFPCGSIVIFPWPAGKKVIQRSIPAGKKLGTEKWVVEKEDRCFVRVANTSFFGALNNAASTVNQ